MCASQARVVRTLGDVEALQYWLELKCKGCGNVIHLPPWAFPGYPNARLDFSRYQCKECSRFGPRHALLIWSQAMNTVDLWATARHVEEMVQSGRWV